MNVLIIGSGYVGVNTGVVLAYLGHKVTCIDINDEKIAALRQGKSHFYEPHLDDVLQITLPNLHFVTKY